MSVSAATVPASSTGTLPGVDVCKIRKTYGSFVAVDELSFCIEPGKIYGLLGPNGAGKTSTLRMILGITEPDSGEIAIFGERLQRLCIGWVARGCEKRSNGRRMTA